jgi:hypothetical protein
MATKAGDMILWVDDDLRCMYGYINEVRLTLSILLQP